MIGTWETQRTARSSSADQSRNPSGSRQDAATGNVSDAERIISGIIGGLLLSRLSLRSLPGAVTGVVGVGLLYRAMTGHCPLYEKLAGLQDESEDPWISNPRRDEGTIAGGLGEQSPVGNFDPAAEEAYWRESYVTRPYYEKDIPFEHYAPAYRYGWESRSRHPNFSFHEVEPQLQLDWERNPGQSAMEWNRARLAAMDAWERADANLLGES